MGDSFETNSTVRTQAEIHFPDVTGAAFTPGRKFSFFSMHTAETHLEPIVKQRNSVLRGATWGKFLYLIHCRPLGDTSASQHFECVGRLTPELPTLSKTKKQEIFVYYSP